MHNTALFPASYIASASVISGAQPYPSLPPHSGRGPAAASVSIRQHPSAYGDGAVERDGRGECRAEAVRGRLMSQLAKLQRVLQLELSSKASSKAS